jgi:cytochrome c6
MEKAMSNRAMGPLSIILAAMLGVAPRQVPAAGADDGKKLYKAKCASCHGADAKGSPAMAKMFKVDADVMSLIDENTFSKKDEDIAKAIADGKGKMKGYKGKLSDGEINALVRYIRSLGPSKGSTDARSKP